MRIKTKRPCWLLFFPLALLCSGTFTGCANKTPKMDHPEEVKVQGEFDKLVNVVEIETPPPAPPTSVVAGADVPAPIVDAEKTKIKAKKERRKRKKKDSHLEASAEKSSAAGAETAPVAQVEKTFQMQPELKEQGLEKSPFRVGEKVFHKVRYFAVNAGTLEMDVKPFVQVNGRKAFRFVTSIQSSPLFSSFYSVDDSVQTDVDAESLLPLTFMLNVKESAQIKEGKSFFDHKGMRATYWETKFTEKSGREEKKQDWELEPYAQNVFSAAFYLRNFKWAVGDERSFVVSDDEKNLTFKALAVRKEHISTDAGEFDAIVLKPTITLKAKFQPMGETNIWISDDDRHYILKIACEIKIGTLVSEIAKLTPGTP